MALSDADLHWIPMNRNKFDQLRKMFDNKEQMKRTAPCDKCTSPRIRYTSAENVTALAQIRALLRPVDHHDDSSTSSRSRNTSEDSLELRTAATRIQNGGVVVIDPLLCSKNLTLLSNENVGKRETVAEITENIPVTEETRVVNGTVTPPPNLVILNSLSSNKNTVSLPESDTNQNEENNNVVENGTSHHNNANDEVEVDGDPPSPVYDEEITRNNVFLNMVNAEAEILTKEREYFLELIEQATDASEEAGGRVMSACGKANLLLTSKFKQYRGLCKEYEKTSRTVTADDMQGFWELILIQVDDVKNQFAALRKLETTQWVIPKSPIPSKKKTNEKPIVKKKATREKTPAQLARDEARRKMLAAKKLEMKARMMEGCPASPEIIIT